MSTTRLFFTLCLGGGLALLGFSAFRQAAPLSAPVENHKVERQEVIRNSGPTLQGAEARRYLEQPGEGRSLMQAITAARFGIAWQKRTPSSDSEAGGYLAISQGQNFKTWFGEVVS